MKLQTKSDMTLENGILPRATFSDGSRSIGYQISNFLVHGISQKKLNEAWLLRIIHILSTFCSNLENHQILVFPIYRVLDFLSVTSLSH